MTHDNASGAERYLTARLNDPEYRAVYDRALKRIDNFFDEYWFLSNFYPIDVTLDGEVYPSVEHAYQAAKFSDSDLRWAIRRASTSNKAKRLGQRLHNYGGMLTPNWDTRKVLIMYGLLTHKFSGELGDKLLATGDSKLIEGNNWHDNFWGSCTCSDCVTLHGENWLGRLLMVVRDELR